MAQAFRGSIIFPNKQREKFEKFHNGKLIDSDTYIGGTVECLQQGVYRSDFPVKFKLVPDGYQKLIDATDEILKFAIEIESVIKRHPDQTVWFHAGEFSDSLALTHLTGELPFYFELFKRKEAIWSTYWQFPGS